MRRPRLCWMISIEGCVVVIYLGFLQLKRFWERVISGRRSLKIVLMWLRGATLSRCSHIICARNLPRYIPLSLPVPSLSGGSILWIATQLRLGAPSYYSGYWLFHEMGWGYAYSKIQRWDSRSLCVQPNYYLVWDSERACHWPWLALLESYDGRVGIQVRV